MKKFFVLALLLVALSAAYSGTSDSKIIQSVVPETLSISSNMPSTTTVDVFSTSQTALGFISVFSNSPGNWSITFSSTNAGSMKGVTADNTDVYPYTLKFGTKSNINLATPYTVEFSGETTADGAVWALGIEFQNFWNLASPISPDTYRDTITITISAG